MDKKLYELGDDVNNCIVKAQATLAGYNFYTAGNHEGKAEDSDINKLRDLLRDVEYLSRSLSAQGMILGVK